MADHFTARWATLADLPVLREVMDLAIGQLQAGFLTPEQIVASRAVMGLDTQLVEDGTYLIAERDGAIAGCGGWSRRATLYGGDHSTALRRPELLDPARNAAKIRAMYTHPEFARQGVGRLVLDMCECAAAAAGFASVELMATLSGEPLYRACGYAPVERISNDAGGAPVPLVRMRKVLVVGG